MVQAGNDEHLLTQDGWRGRPKGKHAMKTGISEGQRIFCVLVLAEI